MWNRFWRPTETTFAGRQGPSQSAALRQGYKSTASRKYDPLHQPKPLPGKATVGTGAPYWVDAAELDMLQSRTFGPHDPRFRPYRADKRMQEAVDRLARVPKKDSEYTAAAKRISDALPGPCTWGLVIKMFNDLDTVYFHGDLKRRIFLRWATVEEFENPYALGTTLAPARHAGRPRISILLRYDVDWDELPKNYQLGNLLHEALHAYLEIHCTERGSVERGCPDPFHGPLYMRAARILERASGLDLTSRPQDMLDLGTGPEQHGADTSSGYRSGPIQWVRS